MPHGKRPLAPGALLALVMFAPAAFAQEHSATPMEIEVPFAPQAVSVGGAARLFYEFHLASHARGGGTLDEVEVVDPATSAVLADVSGPALDGLILRPGAKDVPAEPRWMAPGSTAVVFMEHLCAHGRGAPQPPSLLRVSFSADAPVDPRAASSGRRQWRAKSPSTSGRPITIGYPLPARPMAGGQRSLEHVQPSPDPAGCGAGRDTIAQRYAIDWIKLGPDGRPFHGDRGINANWYSFGTSVLAVADATVSAANDGLPENEPDKLGRKDHPLGHAHRQLSAPRSWRWPPRLLRSSASPAAASASMWATKSGAAKSLRCWETPATPARRICTSD